MMASAPLPMAIPIIRSTAVSRPCSTLRVRVPSSPPTSDCHGGSRAATSVLAKAEYVRESSRTFMPAPNVRTTSRERTMMPYTWPMTCTRLPRHERPERRFHRLRRGAHLGDLVAGYVVRGHDEHMAVGGLFLGHPVFGFGTRTVAGGRCAESVRGRRLTTTLEGRKPERRMEDIDHRDWKLPSTQSDSASCRAPKMRTSSGSDVRGPTASGPFSRRLAVF